ncbi:hypothetical protein QR680_016634 [Steinernema hermaphroditum]|uniref:Cadherin domain-containing protein n=1 Tax=Steinernema hermaphroditum TaxID=289476 RepID=A0AA39HBT6_9BILA|nr:hypothetical protein QR680_016634 [Steinernema hermaphroditum]
MSSSVTVMAAFLLLLSSLVSSTPFRADLPFFLFASDKVDAIKFEKELPCVFVVSTATKVDLSKITLEFSGPNGDASSTPLSDILRQRVKCFDKGEYLYINNAGAFDQAPEEARSVVLYFISKAKFEGPCKDQGYWQGNVFASSDANPKFASVSADCPAVYLTTSSCPKVQMEIDVDKLSESNLLVSSPRWGGQAATNLFTVSADSAATYNDEILLRSVLMVSTLEESFITNVVKVTAVATAGADCGITKKVKSDKAASGLIQSDPLATGASKFTFSLEVDPVKDVSFPDLKLSGVTYDKKGMLEVAITTGTGKTETLSSFSLVVVPDVSSATVTYTPDKDCTPDTCTPLSISYELIPFKESPPTTTTTPRHF